MVLATSLYSNNSICDNISSTVLDICDAINAAPALGRSSRGPRAYVQGMERVVGRYRGRWSGCRGWGVERLGSGLGLELGLGLTRVRVRVVSHVTQTHMDTLTVTQTHIDTLTVTQTHMDLVRGPGSDRSRSSVVGVIVPV